MKKITSTKNGTNGQFNITLFDVSTHPIVKNMLSELIDKSPMEAGFLFCEDHSYKLKRYFLEPLKNKPQISESDKSTLCFYMNHNNMGYYIFTGHFGLDIYVNINITKSEFYKNMDVGFYICDSILYLKNLLMDLIEFKDDVL